MALFDIAHGAGGVQRRPEAAGGDLADHRAIGRRDLGALAGRGAAFRQQADADAADPLDEFTLDARESAELDAIDAALKRIEDGVYGICTDCGVDIPAARLHAAVSLPLGMLGWLGVGWLGSAALAPAAWGARPIVELAQWVATWPSVSRIDLGIAAGLAVVLGLCVGRRDREGRLRPGWRWLPPLPVALGVLLVVGWPRPSPSVSSRWWAVGHPTAPAVVTMAVEPEHDRTIACVHSVAVAASRWPRLLDAMGADAATWSREGPRAPHEQDLERVLQQRRQWVDGPVACPAPPSMEQVKAGLRACRRRSTRRHSMLVMADDGPRCFVRGRWEGPISGRVE